MDCFKIGTGLLIVAMLINLAMAIRERAAGKPFHMFYRPPNAHPLVVALMLVPVFAFGVVALGYWLFDLPRDYLTATFLVAILIESWISVFYRLREVPSDSKAPD